MRMNINRRRNSVTIEMKSCLRRHRLSHQHPCHGVLLQPLSSNDGGGAFGCAGVRLLRATSWCHLGELILNFDNGLKSFGEAAEVLSQETGFGAAAGAPDVLPATKLGMEKACGRPTDKHLVRQWMCTAGLRALNSSLGISKVCPWSSASL